jgi:hypothetical protein
MNKYQSALIEIKKVLGLATEIQVALAAVKLVDGTEINVSKLEVGATATIVAEDGSEAPVPAGTYETEDGHVIEIDEQGIITKYDVKPETDAAEEEAAVEQSTELAEADAAPAGDLEKVVADLDVRVTALEEAMAQVLGLSKDMATSTQELSKKLDMATDAKPIKRTPSETKNTDLFDDTIKQISQTLKSLKK